MSHSLYRKLTRLYPQAYRERYADQMSQTLEDMIAAAPANRQRILVRAYLDLPISLAHQHLVTMENVLTQQTPTYVRRNGLVAGLLTLPFFLALLANGADKVLHNHTLYQSWLWSFPALATWVLILPACALALATATYLIYFERQLKSADQSWWRIAFDLRRNWPLILTAAVAAGILAILFFHDSTHCFVQNPFSLIRHWHQAMICVRNS